MSRQLSSMALRALAQQRIAQEAGAGARGFASQLAVKGVDALKAGPGGRSSVSGVTATIFGCSGFLGRYVAQSLGAAGCQLVLPYRCDDLDIQHLRPMGDLGQVVQLREFDARSDEKVRHAVSRSNVVINLLGAERETWNYGFEEVHVEFAARIARACAESGGVERLLHFSCLGAEADAPSRRLRTKAAGEAAVRAEMGDKVTVFKPAAATGTEDRLFNAYASLAKRLPFVPLIDGGATRLQPVWVRDVAAAVMAALHTRESLGKTYHLAGPDVMTVRELVDFTFDTIREARTRVTVPAALARAACAPGEWLGRRTPLRPFHMFTSDYIDEMKGDYALPSSGVLTFSDLDVVPHRVTEGLPIEYLRHFRAGGYDFGTTAGGATAGGAQTGGWARE